MNAEIELTVLNSAGPHYFTEIGKTPLLTPDMEHALARSIEIDAAALRRIVLASPVARRQIRNWAELIEQGELDPKELLPRGSPDRRKIARMGRRVRALSRLIARREPALAKLRERIKHAHRRPEKSLRFEARLRRSCEGIGEKIAKLNLHPDKVRRLMNRIKDQARRLREGRPTDPLPCPKEELLELDRSVTSLDDRSVENKRRLLQANLRLVVAVARGYATTNMEFADLIQTGGLGLMRAVEMFRSAKGCRFSTYATWWIRQSIARAIFDQDRTVRIPAHIHERMTRAKRIGRAFEGEYGRPPSLGEYAQRMRLRTDKVEDALIAMQDPVSLSSPIGSDGEDDLENLIPDPGAPPPEGRAEAFFRRVQVENWISTLSPREADILRMRYGIGRESSLSLNQVGRIFHVTRERARQIQAGALRKLRDSPRFTVMRDYLH